VTFVGHDHKRVERAKVDDRRQLAHTQNNITIWFQSYWTNERLASRLALMTVARISSGSTFEREIGFSRAVVDGDLIYVSGTTGFDYRTMTIGDGIVEQTEQCFVNIESALVQAGASLADVVRVRYLLPRADDFAATWPILLRVLGDVRPAATMIECGLADPRMRIEIEIVARRGRGAELQAASDAGFVSSS
jgi:enamine deaminase RidA (YjgF/YER057c/UK114 family)